MMDDYLIHYGVKGMKWGVRKAPERSGSFSRVARKKNRILDFVFRRNRPKKPAMTKAVKKQEKVTEKSVKKMSDAEIAQRTDRLQREKRLLDLEGTSTAQKGKSILSEVATDVAKNSLKQIATQQLVKRGNALIDKKLGLPTQSADDIAKKAVAKEKEAQADWLSFQTEKARQDYYDQQKYKQTAWKRAKHAKVGKHAKTPTYIKIGKHAKTPTYVKVGKHAKAA